MSRRCTWTQAFDAWVELKDYIELTHYQVSNTDGEEVTKRKLAKLHSLTNAVSVVGSYLANPDKPKE